jgi:hypothetical protein
MEKRYMDQNYTKNISERGDGIFGGRATAVWSKQVVEGAV